MKRYTHDYDYGSNLKASPNGIWVKYEDVKKVEELNRELVEIIRAECADCKVEELNREMVEVMERVAKEYLEDIVYHSISYDAYMQVSIALTKAKGEK